MLDLTKLTTETRNDKTMNLDQMTPAELAAVMNEEDGNVVKAVKEVIPEIATAIEWATESLNRVCMYGVAPLAAVWLLCVWNGLRRS